MDARKIDTGMGRIGLKDIESYQHVVHKIDQHERLIFEGVYTHFASADEPNDFSKSNMNYLKNL